MTDQNTINQLKQKMLEKRQEAEKACTHTITTGGEWVTSSYHAPDDEGYDGEDMEWEPEWEKPTTVDIDLHHRKCTQCGEVMRY